MAEFPQELYVTIEDTGGDDEWLSVSKTKVEAVETTSNDQEDGVQVATYQLVSIRKMKVSKTVAEE